VRELAQPGVRIDVHPLPQGVQLGEDPLRSWRDMAVIVGSEWEIPDELRPHYPETVLGMNATDDDGGPIQVIY
jgi:hypothetical protein